MLIDADLTDEQAWLLAQFLKRAGFTDYLRLAIDKDEAYVMLDAGEKLRAALAELGFTPR
jgi:hypothetical protein